MPHPTTSPGCSSAAYLLLLIALWAQHNQLAAVTLQDIEPNFFLALLLPLIIYAAAISMHWHTLRRCLFQVRLKLPSLPGTINMVDSLTLLW